MIALSAGSGATTNSPKMKMKTYVDNTYWGYIIRGAGLRNLINLPSQLIAAGVGLVLVLSSLVFWLVTGTTLVTHFGGLEYGMSIALFLFGLVLIWFASHGTDFELHANVETKELNEMVRNSKGQTRLLRTIPFIEVASVFIDRPTRSGDKARLSLRLRNCSKVVVIATDIEDNLRPIHARLVRDVLPMAQGAYAKEHCETNLIEPMLNTVMPRRVVSNRPARGFMFRKAQGVVIPRRVMMAA